MSQTTKRGQEHGRIGRLASGGRRFRRRLDGFLFRGQLGPTRAERVDLSPVRTI